MEVNTLTQSNDETNATNTITIAAQTKHWNQIYDWEVVVSGAATGAVITVTLLSGATVKWKSIIASGAPIGTRIGMSYQNGLPADAKGEAMSLVATAGGAACVVTCNVAYASHPS